MSDRYKVGTVDEIPENGDRTVVEVNDSQVAVFRIRDQFHAIANTCPHQSGPVCEGKLKGQVKTDEDSWIWNHDDTEQYIACPWHGWVFDVITGTNVQNERYQVQTYDVEVEDGVIFVKI